MLLSGVLVRAHPHSLTLLLGHFFKGDEFLRWRGPRLKALTPQRHVHGDGGRANLRNISPNQVIRANKVGRCHGVTNCGVPFGPHVLLCVEKNRELRGGDSTHHNQLKLGHTATPPGAASARGHQRQRSGRVPARRPRPGQAPDR